MDRATVPETTIDEDSDPLPCEHDVGANVSAGKVEAEVAPKAHPGTVKGRPKCQLGLGVASAIGLHIPSAPSGRRSKCR